MTKFSFSGFLLCIFLFSSIAKGQSVTYTAKKHKGKWALVSDNNTPVTEYVYDSITSRVYTFSTLDRTSTPLKVTQPEKTIYFLWQNGRFDVFYKMIVVSGVSAFEPCSRMNDDLLKYSFRTGNSWGWGINRGNPSKPSENYNSPASYDSVRFLITQQFLTDPEALAKNDNQMDLTGYTYYALYLSSDIQAYKDGCLLLVSSYGYSEKKFCDVLYFVSIPEVFMVKKKAAGNIKFVRADERFSQFEYDSVASIYGLWMGFNKGQATADIFTDTSRSTVPYTATTNWIAVRDQFKKDIIKNDLVVKEKETAKRQQEEAANIKKREQQLQDELVKKKAGARERLKQIKEMNMMVYTWKNNDSLLGLRIRGKELIYPSAKKVELNGHSDFRPVVITPGGYQNITMSPAYILKYSAKDSLELLPEELYVKILHTIDTATKASQVPILTVEADIRIYDATAKHNFLYTKIINPDLTPDGFSLYESQCPVCHGRGYLVEGDGSVQEVTKTEKKLVKTGTVGITKKNYLANEEVDSRGQKVAPTYSQSYDKYEYVDVTSTEEKTNRKTVVCFSCKGSKKGSLWISWQTLQQKYISVIN